MVLTLLYRQRVTVRHCLWIASLPPLPISRLLKTQMMPTRDASPTKLGKNGGSKKNRVLALNFFLAEQYIR